MIAFSVIRLKVGAILLDYQLFINHAPHHAPKHALNTHFAAATVSSFETTFLFYPLPFEKHIPFHKITIIWRIPRNSSFPNSWDWQNLRHSRQWPRSSINDLERLVTWAPYTYRRCKWSWQQGELLCCFDFLVPCTNPMQTTGTQEWLWKCWDAIVCGWPPCSERGSATVIADWIPLVAF